MSSSSKCRPERLHTRTCSLPTISLQQIHMHVQDPSPLPYRAFLSGATRMQALVFKPGLRSAVACACLQLPGGLRRGTVLTLPITLPILFPYILACSDEQERCIALICRAVLVVCRCDGLVGMSYFLQVGMTACLIGWCCTKYPSPSVSHHSRAHVAAFQKEGQEMYLSCGGGCAAVRPGSVPCATQIVSTQSALLATQIVCHPDCVPP